jgi:hypothetical protein
MHNTRDQLALTGKRKLFAAWNGQCQLNEKQLAK